MRIKPGQDARLVTAGRTGLVVETATRRPLGSSVELVLSDRGTPRLVRARVVRCEVASLTGSDLRYHLALEFLEPLEADPAPNEGTVHAAVRVPAPPLPPSAPVNAPAHDPPRARKPEPVESAWYEVPIELPAVPPASALQRKGAPPVTDATAEPARTSPVEPLSTVLVIDDDPDYGRLLRSLLEAAGYAVRTATSASLALQELARAPIAVALCDVRLPDKDGFWLAEYIRHCCPDCGIVMVTGLKDCQHAIRGLRAGVEDFLLKPVDEAELFGAVQRAIRRRDRSAEASARVGERPGRDVPDRVVEARAHLQAWASAHALLGALTANCKPVAEHASRVARLAVRIGGAMSAPESELETIEQAALVHDFGRLLLPETLLKKPAPLDPEEWLAVQTHCVMAYDLLLKLGMHQQTAAAVKGVRERYDGTGYPDKLSAAEIPLAARVIAVAEAFDTMLLDRPYAPRRSPGDAVLELLRARGTQFDPAVVDGAIRVIPVP